MLLPILTLLTATHALIIVQSNDDGWAESNIRTLNTVLRASNNQVLLSAPADNKSGSSSLDFPALPRLTSCQYNSCPLGPGIGSTTDPLIQYVNSFPVTAMKNGISAAQRFGTPDLALTGPNVGSNLDYQVAFSGTVGAAVEAVRQGIPAVAFSGLSGQPTYYADGAPLWSRIYADLAMNLTTALVGQKPYLPAGVFLNVNFPSVERCPDVSAYQFVLTRIWPGVSDDVENCGSKRLPMERTVVESQKECFVSVSPADMDKTTTNDIEKQRAVKEKLGSILSCFQ